MYLELLGSGILYSINYDRIYENKISIRSGFSYIPKIDLGMAGYISPGYTLPLSISKLISIGADNHIELGVAHTFLLIENNLTNSFGPIIGFREQNLTLGGGLVRFSFTPMIFPRSEKLIYFTGGLSVGKSF